MIVPSSHIELLQRPLSYWIGTAGSDRVPEVIKSMSIIFDPAIEQFTCFVSEKYAAKTLQNLSVNPAISLVGVDVPTYEGYQYKGKYVLHRSCTEKEELMQVQARERFTDLLEGYGYSKSGFSKIFFNQPSIAIVFLVAEVFEQIPKKGTGGRLSI
jgi:hypothetical protein